MSINKEKLCMGCMSAMESGGKCPHCGYHSDTPHSSEYLAPKTELAQRYIVGRLLSHNGEGALYMGYDSEEDRKVLVREYMPTHFSSRNEANGNISPKNGKEAQFKALMYDFAENAHLIKVVSEKTSGILPTLALLQEKGTVYVIYRYIQSLTLSEYLLKNGGDISWSLAKPMFLPLFKAVAALHAQGAIHRGISPETILVDNKGKLWLAGLTISAVRTGMSELPCELYDGYTAPEQYSASGWQGTWTDVYACAAVLYRALTGTMPVSGELRKEKDSLYLANMLNPAVPQSVSCAIDCAMLVAVEKRTQTVDKLVAELLETADGNTAVFDTHAYTAQPQTNNAPRTLLQRLQEFPPWLRVMLGTSAALLVVLILLYFTLIKPSLASHGKPSETSSTPELVQSVAPEPQDSGVPDFTKQFASKVMTNPAYVEKYDFTVEEAYSEDDIPAGVVYNQSTPPGTPMPNRGTIILYVSKGSQHTKMPYLVGSTRDLAMRTLEDLDISYDIAELEDEKLEPGLIIRTSVEPGSEILRGTEQVQVILYIKKEAPPTSSEEENSTE